MRIAIRLPVSRIGDLLSAQLYLSMLSKSY
jgi:hypothetical protein